MKCITKLLALSFALLISLNLATAQQGQRKEKMKKFENAEAFAQKQTERFTETLSLTADQTAKVAAINLEYANKMKAAKEAATGKEEGRAATKALRTEHHAAIKTLLTPEQTATFEQKRQERGGKRGDRKNHTPEERAEKRTERLTEKLTLSTDQATKVAAINLEYANKMNAAKEAAADREAGRTAKDALRTEHKNAIKAVLTTEQIATFESMKEDKKGKRGRRGGRGQRG